MGKIEMNGLQHTNLEKAKQFIWLAGIVGVLALATIYSNEHFMSQAHNAMHFVTELMGTMISGGEDVLSMSVDATRGNLHVNADFVQIAQEANRIGLPDFVKPESIATNPVTQFFARGGNILP